MKSEICECGHEYTFHDVLDNEACHLMDCPCKKFKPKNHCQYHTEFVNICAHCQEARDKTEGTSNSKGCGKMIDNYIDCGNTDSNGILFLCSECQEKN